MSKTEIKRTNGFTLIEILMVLAVLIITTAGGVVIWEKKVAPGPTALPTSFPTTQPTFITAYQTPTPTPNPKQEFTFPTQYSCNSDSDCVLKDRSYCCGEKLEHYKWCYRKDVEPEVVSCKGVGSCPGLVGSAKSCVCQNGKCTAIFTTKPSSRTTPSMLFPPSCKADSDCHDEQGNPIGICNVPCQDKAICQDGICVKPMMNLPGIQ